jgi:phosphatidylserine/phosphatidylglycerophosphate/cardiolipin synthase-like enzyme
MKSVTKEAIDQLLSQTLDDYRLSRNERQVLKAALDEHGVTEEGLALVRHRAFQLARESLIDPEAHRVLEWLEEVIKALQPAPSRRAEPCEAYFSPGDQCARQIARLLGAARHSVDICVFTITDDRVTEAILETHRRGVAVRIVTDKEKSHDPGSDVNRLREAGIPVRVDQDEYHMHHKFAILDKTALLTGSYNWTRGAGRNMENIIVSRDRLLVQDFSEVFEQLWEQLR